MGKIMIIGAGGVANVAIHKCAQVPEVFEEIMIASRTRSKCDAIKESLDGKTTAKITTAQVDADNTDELIALINEYKPRSRAQSGAAVPGSDHHGRLSGDQDPLCGYRQLRAQG